MDSGDITLEKSLELFEKGMRLIQEGKDKLQQAEERVQTLINESDNKSKAKE
jgi:exodeoxyribonuclease VII small subunit